MANIPNFGQSVSGWNPGPGPKEKSADKLMSTEASDAKDTMTGTNELKPFLGGSGKPPGPFGQKGTEF